MSRNLGALTFWNPVGLFRPVKGRLYVFTYRSTLKGGVHKVTALTIRHCISSPPNKCTSSSSFTPPLSPKTGAVEVTRFIYGYIAVKKKERKQ
jgi:hypothetical protein